MAVFVEILVEAIGARAAMAAACAAAGVTTLVRAWPYKSAAGLRAGEDVGTAGVGMT